MNNPISKQSDAIHMATRELYLSVFGEFNNELLNDTGFYGLIVKRINERLCREFGVAEFDELSIMDRSNALATLQLRYHQVIEAEDDFGKKYLYHNAYFGAFLDKVEFEKSLGIPFRYYLEINYSPNSSFKPQQLDTWEDYQYLAEKMRQSLNDSELDLTAYQRQYLAEAVLWFTERFAELRTQEERAAPTPDVIHETTASLMPAPPAPHVPISLDDLCLSPFTQADLTKLLIELKAIPEESPYRWTERPASKKAVQSKIVAALSVLSKSPDSLFKGERELWEEPVKSTYGVSLGKLAIDYRYGFKGLKKQGSTAFDTAHDKTSIWLKRWKSMLDESQ